MAVEITTQHIAGGIALIGGVAVMLSRLGFLRIGKQEKCPDIACQQATLKTQQSVIHIHDDISRLAQEYASLAKDVSTIATDVAFIKGRINGHS